MYDNDSDPLESDDADTDLSALLGLNDTNQLLSSDSLFSNFVDDVESLTSTSPLINVPQSPSPNDVSMLDQQGNDEPEFASVGTDTDINTDTDIDITESVPSPLFQQENSRMILSNVFYAEISYRNKTQAVFPGFELDELKRLLSRNASNSSETWNKVRNYIYCQKIIFINNDALMTAKIDFETLLELFQIILTSRNQCIIRECWNNIELLRAYFSGYLIVFEQGDFQAIDLEKSLQYFQYVLASRNTEVIKKYWDGNAVLRYLFTKQPIFKKNFLVVLEFFKKALASNSVYIIKAIWYGNKLLRDYLCGLPISLSEVNNAITLQLELSFALVYFESILSSHCMEVIEEVWKNNNDLVDYINYKVDIDRLKNFLEKLLTVFENTQQRCINEILPRIEGRAAEVLSSIWDELHNIERKSQQIERKINIIESYFKTHSESVRNTSSLTSVGLFKKDNKKRKHSQASGKNDESSPRLPRLE